MVSKIARLQAIDVLYSIYAVRNFGSAVEGLERTSEVTLSTPVGDGLVGQRPEVFGRLQFRGIRRQEDEAHTTGRYKSVDQKKLRTPRGGYLLKRGRIRSSSSAICTAFRAAPFLRLSATTQRFNPFSIVGSLRIRLT